MTGEPTERRIGAAASGALGTESEGGLSFVPVLRRWWWVAAIGIAVAILTAGVMVYSVSLSPPGLTARDQPEYTATARLLVTSSEDPYLRLSVPRTVETDSGSAGNDGGRAGRPVTYRDVPNVAPLLQAANLYPLLIESDQISKLRSDLFGPTPGTVTASAVSSVRTPTRYVPSQIPVIEIAATSGSARQAIVLARTTATAFERFITLQQNRTKLTRAERILIRELVTPRQAVASGGSSYGIPVLVVLAVLAAFGVLVLVLDRVFVPGAGAPKTRVSEPTTARASEAA